MSHVGVYIPSDEAEITSVEVAVGDRVRTGSLLFTCKNQSNETQVKSTVVGVVKEIVVQKGTCVTKHEAILFIERNCDHSVVAFNLCAICGMDMKSNKDAPGHLSMVPAIPQVTVNEQEAHRLGNKDKQQLLDRRKLALIVDLDQTLVHTSVDRSIERGLPDVYGFTLSGHPYLYHCRLRPHAMEFLQTVSHLFELHVFTMATKDYAYAVTGIIDPEKKLFSDRVISRDECFDPHSKAPRLKSVFPCGDEMVAIIDDREDVWKSCPNLVHVKPYVFFAGTWDINAPPPKAPPTSSKSSGLASSNPLPVVSSSSNTNTNNNKPSHNKRTSSGQVSSSSSSSGSSSEGDNVSSTSDSDVSSMEDSKQESITEGAQVSTASVDNNEVVPSVDKGASSNTEQRISARKIEDRDNFLVHLGQVLTRIHETFYKEYDKMKQVFPELSSDKAIRTPDLKEIIPRLRKSVFNNCNILFSGVIPLGTSIEKSREWNTTRAFGGNVHSDLMIGPDSINNTTHLVVGRPDTVKYKRARKIDGITIVNPGWFWTSAERWVRQNEQDYQPDFHLTCTTTKKPDKVGEPRSKNRKVLTDEDESSARPFPDQSGSGLKYTRTFSISSEELIKMEAEIDAELSSDESDSNGQLGSYVIKQKQDDSLDSFNAYLGLEDVESSRKRKRGVDHEASSNSTSLDGGDISDSSGDDELAHLLMM